MDLQTQETRGLREWIAQTSMLARMGLLSERIFGLIPQKQLEIAAWGTIVVLRPKERMVHQKPPMSDTVADLLQMNTASLSIPEMPYHKGPTGRAGGIVKV